MNKTTAITAIIAIIAATALFRSDFNSSVDEIPKEVVFAFNQWKLGQKRLYASPEEQNHRLTVFYQNYQKVENVNSQELSYKFKLNDFADMSQEEFHVKYLMKAQEAKVPKGAKVAREEDFEPVLNQAADFNWCDNSRAKCSAVRT
jgi:hypothetical protein